MGTSVPREQRRGYVGHLPTKISRWPTLYRIEGIHEEGTMCTETLPHLGGAATLSSTPSTTKWAYVTGEPRAPAPTTLSHEGIGPVPITLRDFLLEHHHFTE